LRFLAGSWVSRPTPADRPEKPKIALPAVGITTSIRAKKLSVCGAFCGEGGAATFTAPSDNLTAAGFGNYIAHKHDIVLCCVAALPRAGLVNRKKKPGSREPGFAF
jgi:hypothetical protein